MAASNHALKIEQEDLEPEPLVGAGDTGRSIKLPLGKEARVNNIDTLRANVLLCARWSMLPTTV